MDRDDAEPLPKTHHQLSARYQAQLVSHSEEHQIEYIKWARHLSRRTNLTRCHRLSLGGNYREWCRGVRHLLSLRGGTTTRFAASWDISEDEIPRSDPSSDTLDIIISLVCESLLSRIPESLKGTAEDLLSVLPEYSKPFRFMGLPPELRIRVYRAVEIPADLAFVSERHRGEALSPNDRLPPFPPLMHICSLLRKEVIPELVPSMMFHFTRDTPGSPLDTSDSVNIANFCPDMLGPQFLSLAGDVSRYITCVALCITTSDLNLLLQLNLEPKRALQYDIQVTSGCISMPREELLEPRAEEALEKVIARYELDVAMPCSRGDSLLACLRQFASDLGPTVMADLLDRSEDA